MYRRATSQVSWRDSWESLEEEGEDYNCLFCWGKSGIKKEKIKKEPKKESVVKKGLIKFNTGSFIQSNSTTSFYDDYEVGEMIGSGSYGAVFACYHHENGKERAVKIVPKSDKDKDNESVVNEFNIIKGLDHPNVVKVYELFHDDKNFYIVTEIYRGGELFDEINDHGVLSEEDASLLIMNVLTCVNYCHKENLVHGDLKVENILLDDNLKFQDIKLIDFGLSFICNPANQQPHDVTTDKEISELIRTPAYQAPEVIDGIVGPKSDVWSVGVITFVVLGGYTPFRGATVEEILKQVVEGNVHFDYDVWDDVSNKAKDFICYLLDPDEDERPTAEEALKHPWLLARKQKSKKEFKATKRQSAIYSLGKLKQFRAKSKLKQATAAFIAAQLLTKRERDEIDDVFRALDESCDGKLDAKELQEGYNQYYGDKLSREEVENLVAQVDADNTGYIEYSEFLVASMSRRNLFDDDRVEIAFRNFDKDHDGVIDMKDLRTALSIDKKLDGAVKKIVHEADIDGDGKITLDEFKSLLMQQDTSERGL